MDAGIYARLSRNRCGLSDNVEIQIAESEGYAEDKLWSVVLVESGDDISASKFSNKPRPGYNRLIEAVRAGRIEVIICTETCSSECSPNSVAICVTRFCIRLIVCSAA